MSETKWTPGPWKWRDDRCPDSTEGEFRGLDGPNGEGVIRLEDVYPGYAECGEDLRSCIERPNQFLIAAAPELYDALAQFVDSALIFGGHGEIVGKAKAALAKARGEHL